MKKFALFLTLLPVHVSAERALTLNTIYGTYSITEPVIIDLLEHPMMQRLQKVHQYGLDYYLNKPIEYNRYEHSLGVFVLLRRFGASKLEQVAGLLHDVSHTAFSHVADYLFKAQDEKSSYQDEHHEDFLRESGLAAVLEKHGISVEDIHHKHKYFKGLEQELPDICADRLEYNLMGGFVEGLISHKEIKQILNDLRYEHGRWFFTDASSACRFAECPLYMTEHTWTSAKSMIINTLAADLLQTALDAKVVSLNDIRFGSDEEIWLTMNNTHHSSVWKVLCKIQYCVDNFYVSNENHYDLFVKGKFRGIDPWVKKNGSFYRLTEIDPQFKVAYEKLKDTMSRGCYITYR